MGLIFGALVLERRRTEQELRHANDSLELRVQERTLSLSRMIADLKAAAETRKRIEKTLRESEDRFQLLVETIKDYAIFLLDAEGNVASWNAGAERIKGYTEDEIVGRHFSVFFTPDDIAAGRPEKELEKARTEGRAEAIGYRVRKDGSLFWADVSITALVDKSGQLRGFAKVTRDITDRQRVEEALKASEARFRQLVDSNIIGFMLMDEQNRIMDANDALLSMLGYTRSDLWSNELREKDITPETFRVLDQWAQERLMTTGTCPPMEKEFIRKDGARVPVIVGMVQLHGAKGQRVSFVIDVTERRSAQDALRRAYDELEMRVQQRTAELQEEIKRREHAEEELRSQAIRDPLTGLYNRRGFLTLGDKHLDVARRQRKPLLLFMADLDDLKLINDMFGHVEGDRVLAKVGDILRATFRQSDIIARIGGDEFAVVGLEEQDHDETELSQRLQKALDDYNRYSGQPYRVQLSVGTARFNVDSAFNLEKGMQQADEMLYGKKKNKSGSPLKIPPV
jgi:diguanylate cyclase (GGDEF)-like protein/PAS domain S-box-containing protein